MRPRALVLLLALTAGDYMLWDWSIAGGHDVLSLVAGLTLLPLAAIGLGGLAIASGRVVSLLLGRSSITARSTQASREADAREQAGHADASESDRSSGRLAA